MTIEINLSPEQYDRAMAEAERRQAVNEAKALRGRNRAPSQGNAALELHRLGCTGEIAVAVYLGLEEDVFTEKEARRESDDLPGRVEVKTRKRHGYDLLVQKSDSREKLFVLTTCDRAAAPERVILAGWNYGESVMKDHLFRSLVPGRPCYVIPQSMLNPIETLKDELRQPAGPVRVLGPEDAWLSREGEDLCLNLSENLLDELSWGVGTVLDWEVDERTNAVRLAMPTND